MRRAYDGTNPKRERGFFVLRPSLALRVSVTGRYAAAKLPLTLPRDGADAGVKWAGGKGAARLTIE